MKRSLFSILDRHESAGGPLGDLVDRVIEEAVEADRLGYSSLWLAEHHFVTVGSVPNPAVVLAAIARATSRIRIGPATAVLPLRNPIQIAEDYALVDVLSSGRLNLGVGSGSQAREFVPFGVDFGKRRKLFDDALGIIKKSWVDAVTGIDGASVINAAPIQKPRPPVFVATSSVDAAEAIGGRGDSLLALVSPGPEGPGRAIACARAHARGATNAAEGEAKPESVVMIFAHAAPSEAQARARVVPALERLLEGMTGEKPADAEGLYESMRAARSGLFGTREDVEEGLETLEKEGLSHVAFITSFGGMPGDAVLESLRLLAPSGVGGETRGISVASC